MFIAEALFNFSEATMKTQQTDKKQDKKKQERVEVQQQSVKRKRSLSQEQQLIKDAEQSQENQEEQAQEKNKSEEGIKYLSFEAGDKILVQTAFENGWWYGNVIKKPDQKGYFPSNYVKVGAKPPPPKQALKSDQNKQEVYDPQEGKQWLKKELDQLKQVQKGAITSDYYHGIKGYKYVKIDDKNKNILNANYVKFDVATGLARVPVKDQAPTAKAVRQMGYYFDYHQWNEERNRNPDAHKARPDPKMKKPKKLRLLGMGKQGQK